MRETITAKTMQVPWGQRVFGAAFERFPALGTTLAGVESSVLREAIDATPIIQPIYVCGLARSGSTILLEALNAHHEVTAHRYSDYPPLWTPYWWNWLRGRLPLPKPAPTERAHGDRIAVTPDSPEAFEEVFWMRFFPGRHQVDVDQRLSREIQQADFEAFYRDHIRKLLLARGAPRYLAKANYHLARLPYLLRLFPGARFIIPVRRPEAHIASLLKQDRLFTAAGSAQPAVRAHLRRIGHFEFGLDKRAENLGDAAQALEIQRCFEQGLNLRAYALQWAASYGHALAAVQHDAQLAAATLWVPYDELCDAPEASLLRLFEHAQLAGTDRDRVIAQFAPTMSAPAYYRSDFSAAERADIESATAAVAAQIWS